MLGLASKNYWWNHFANLAKREERKKISTTPDKNQQTQSETQDHKLALTKLSQTGETSLTSDIVRAETNFLVFPFFALWDKDVKKRTETEYKAMIKRGNEKLEIVWNVSANSKFGYPSPFDKTVYKAIEQIINELPRPVQNPIPLGSFYNLCKEMGINTGGFQYKKIKESLYRIIATTVISEGAFYSKDKEKWVEDAFHLYERLISKGERLENGEVAETNYLLLNSWYLGNINSNYVKPIDWDYYKSLKTPIAQRLYELLGVKFYGVINSRGKKITYRYSTLCDLLPAARQKYRSKAEQVFKPAHEKLKRTGFLADYKWDETTPKTKGDWLITYYVGKRAREEVRKAKTYFKSPQLEFEAEAPDSRDGPDEIGAHLPEAERELLEPEEELEPLTQEQTELLEKLVELNVTRSVADDLVRHFDNEMIQKWTEAIQYADARDKAAYLVDAVRRNWALPEKWLKAKERASDEAKHQKIKQLEDERKEQEKRKRREEAERLNNIYNSLSDEQRQDVDEEAERRISFIARTWIREGKEDSPIVQADRQSKREEVLTEWLDAGKI